MKEARKLEIVWKIWSVEEDNLYDLEERKEKEKRIKFIMAL